MIVRVLFRMNNAKDRVVGLFEASGVAADIDNGKLRVNCGAAPWAEWTAPFKGTLTAECYVGGENRGVAPDMLTDLIIVRGVQQEN